MTQFNIYDPSGWNYIYLPPEKNMMSGQSKSPFLEFAAAFETAFDYLKIAEISRYIPNMKRHYSKMTHYITDPMRHSGNITQHSGNIMHHIRNMMFDYLNMTHHIRRMKQHL